jgi:hypothetical protein
MSRKSRGHEKAEGVMPDIRDRSVWINRKQAARELGVDYRSIPNVATAARLRTKKVPGVRGVRYFLPDVQRVARESVACAS